MGRGIIFGKFKIDDSRFRRLPGADGGGGW